MKSVLRRPLLYIKAVSTAVYSLYSRLRPSRVSTRKPASISFLSVFHLKHLCLSSFFIVWLACGLLSGSEGSAEWSN